MIYICILITVTTFQGNNADFLCNTILQRLAWPCQTILINPDFLWKIWLWILSSLARVPCQPAVASWWFLASAHNNFLGNHHNNPHNSLLWPITQTRRVPGPKKQPSRVQRPGSVGKVVGCAGDSGCAGWGCGRWGRGCGWCGEDRRPPKKPDTPSIAPPAQPYCLRPLPVCPQSFLLIILCSIRGSSST